MYPLVFQKGMTAAKWYGYPKSQQILSIANELNRAQNALLTGAAGNAESAWERAFELTDLFIEGDISSGLLTEILRFREVLGEIFITHDAVAHGKLITALIMLDATAYNMLHGPSGST